MQIQITTKTENYVFFNYNNKRYVANVYKHSFGWVKARSTGFNYRIIKNVSTRQKLEQLLKIALDIPLYNS